LMVVLTIMVVAVSIFSRIVVATSRLRETNRENSIAGEAARIALERMRGGEFREIFARFNSDPEDDPEGPGTAPGNGFLVDGLSSIETSVDGFVGRIAFPTIELSKSDTGGTYVLEDPVDIDVLGPKETGTVKVDQLDLPIIEPPIPPPAKDQTELLLREDVVLPKLGMPRDLNGDSMIDNVDHARDYFILPVHIRIEWIGSNGPRSFDLFTMLTNLEQVG